MSMKFYNIQRHCSVRRTLHYFENSLKNANLMCSRRCQGFVNLNGIKSLENANATLDMSCIKIRLPEEPKYPMLCPCILSGKNKSPCLLLYLDCCYLTPRIFLTMELCFRNHHLSFFVTHHFRAELRDTNR